MFSIGYDFSTEKTSLFSLFVSCCGFPYLLLHRLFDYWFSGAFAIYNLLGQNQAIQKITYIMHFGVACISPCSTHTTSRTALAHWSLLPTFENSIASIHNLRHANTVRNLLIPGFWKIPHGPLPAMTRSPASFFILHDGFSEFHHSWYERIYSLISSMGGAYVPLALDHLIQCSTWEGQTLLIGNPQLCKCKLCIYSNMSSETYWRHKSVMPLKFSPQTDS